jgi:Immunoglobulin domain
MGKILTGVENDYEPWGSIVTTGIFMMKSIIKLSYLALLVLFAYSSSAQEVIWNGYRISYVGKTTISKAMDGNSNTKIRVENISNTAAAPIYFDLYIEGLIAPSAQRNLHGEFGWAKFPNGGALQIPRGQVSFAQSWTQGVYENVMGNQPPASNTSKTYKFHFLFSESESALQGPYPKNPATVLDLPVSITFTNDDAVNLYNSGNKPVRLSVNAKSAGDFEMQLFTESGGFKQNNIFTPTLVQRGNGSATPYIFNFALESRSDWVVKIRKQGKKSEYFFLDVNQSNITINLAEEALAGNYAVSLIKSIKTPTGFWRGAVSEQTRSFVCIPGQENWATTSSAKSASKLYKIDFDGNVQWTRTIGWEAWGGDMSANGKFVAVASNGATVRTELNRNQGGDFIAILNGADGSVYDVILEGIASRNVKFSADGRFLAIGDQSGRFHVYDIANKSLILRSAGSAVPGQNRELQWLDADSSIAISTGDGSVYRYALASDKKSASLVWKAYAGGWGFINGFSVSKSGLYLGLGTKSKDQTIIEAATGRVLWSKFTGNFDVAFTPDANRIATFGGYIYRTLDGVFLGTTGRAGVSFFSPDGNYLMQADRVEFTNRGESDNALTIMNNIGDRIADIGGKSNHFDSSDLTKTGGEQSQWAYWSEDGKRIIVLSRDMDLPEEVGISIYSFDAKVVAATAPTITSQPSASSVAVGSAVSLSVVAGGTAPLSYQWRKDGVAISGATSSTYTIASTKTSDAGNYTVVVTNSAGSVTSNSTVLTVSALPRLYSLAVRTVLEADQILIVGFTMAGGGKNVLLRAVGPTLGAFGVPGTMADPKLDLYRDSSLITSNDNWGGGSSLAATFQSAGAFAYASATSLDAALVASISGGRTAHVYGRTAGAVLVEGYDVGTGDAQRFTGLSARNRVGTGANILIAGFSLSGEGMRNLLIRAVGPTLGGFGVPGVLSDPKLEIFQDSTKIGENDNWSSMLSNAFSSVGAFQLSPGSKDAAITISLPANAYTVQVSGADGGVGEALVEIYELP